MSKQNYDDIDFSAVDTYQPKKKTRGWTIRKAATLYKHMQSNVPVKKIAVLMKTPLSSVAAMQREFRLARKAKMSLGEMFAKGRPFAVGKKVRTTAKGKRGK